MYQINRTKISDCFELIPYIFNDHRGTSIKTYHSVSFESLGIKHGFEEDLLVESKKGVIRGLHYQRPPYEQAKLIMCLKGRIFDVALDIRKNSPTFGQYVTFEIDSRKHNMVYVPAGFAHGYQALEDDTIAYYKMSSVYSPENEGGISYDSLGINWPLSDPVLSEKDSRLKSFAEFVNEHANV